MSETHPAQNIHPAKSTFTTYVGSQPIYNKDLGIYAYQLLFRNSDENLAKFSDGDIATSELILNSLTDIGLDRLVGHHRALIKFTRNFIMGEYPIPKLNKRIIVDLQDNHALDKDIIDALSKLAEQGFTIAITKEVFEQYFSDKPDYKIIVKIDVQTSKQTDFSDLKEHENVRLLADKVETQEDFARCSEHDFNYYGGFFFCQPQIVTGRKIPTSKVQLINLLNKLQDPETSAHELEQLIVSDVTLSYRLLRYANSSFTGLNTRVDSIQHAVSLLGSDTVKMIATLLVLTKIDDKPKELILFGLIRAKMCEHLTEFDTTIESNMAFTAGLLSIMDALLDSQMEDVLAKLPLNDNLVSALLSHEGSLGHMLHDVIAYVGNRQNSVRKSEFSDGILCYAYLQSLVWANSVAPLLHEKNDNK